MTTESGQASGQSSSSSSSQSQAGSASGAQGGASAQGQNQTQQQNSGGQQQQTEWQRPAYVPEKFKTEAEFFEHFNGLSTRDAERVARDAGLPASPDKYEIKLPEGFKPPEGMQFEFKADDPALLEARKAAHEMKLDQAGFSRMLGIYAANKLAEHQAVTAGRQAELDKLGSTAPQRLEAVETWLKAKVGDKAETIISTLKQYPVAANVETFEALMRAFSSQGGASVTQSGREGQDDAGKIPGYDKMTFIQRRAAQMSLKQNQAAGGGGR